MNALEAVVLVALLLLPFHLLVSWQFARLRDPRYVRRCGVVIRCEEILERDEVIGRYAGRDIYRAVRFLGMEYRFDRIVRSGYRHSIGERELFLEPGLIYVTD